MSTYQAFPGLGHNIAQVPDTEINNTFVSRLTGLPGLNHVLQQVQVVAPRRTTVMITGPTGAGKEVVAHTIHDVSGRQKKPFVAINCSALPDTLLESELFGYERGAFTGANAQKQGKLEVANGGTVFLDEIGDVSPIAQVKMLRFLQEREFERLGGNKTIKVDVRIIAATHRDLWQAMQEERFREDLFYRLNVFPIQVPPLSQRRDDVVPLASRFLEEFTTLYEGPRRAFTETAEEVLRSHHWPGNVRELQNIVERLVISSQNLQIDDEDVLQALNQGAPRSPPGAITGGNGVYVIDTNNPDRTTLAMIKRAEDDAYLGAFKVTGEKTSAAQLLGVNRTTFVERLRKINERSPI